MQEMTKPSINQRNQTREIASGQDGPSTRTNAPNSQHVNTSRSSNDANSPMSGGRMESRPSRFESSRGYDNSGQINEYEQLDVSNSPQNDYDTLRGV